MTLQYNADLRLLNGPLPVIYILQSIWLVQGHILGFLTVDFFRGGVVSSTTNPQPGGPGLHIYTPRHRVPILVTFYDMYGLQWDYSFPQSPHGDGSNFTYY
jgi:hypothetical protein